jgi:type VI secretion system secreted protein Hcp
VATAQESYDSSAGVASIFYVTIVASKQGTIHGDVMEKGREGKIRGLDFSYEAEVLASAGQVGGQLHRRPVVLTKAWDSSTPKLLQAFAENEKLNSVLFEFWTAQPTGEEIVYQTVELDDAVIAKVRWYLAEGASIHPAGTIPALLAGPSTQHGRSELEDIAFSFTTMHVQNVKGTAAADSWALPHL